MPTFPDITTLRPTTTAELAEYIRVEAVADHRLVARGAGTAFDWGGRAETADTLIDTTALTGVLRHDPEDMTVAVRAGTSFEELRTLLAEHGQRVSFDPARAGVGATIGGLVVTADSGPLRQAYGSLRSLVIGITFVLPDGTVVRSGGQVIKNVAGYDLAKLLHGSLGTLGIVAEVVLRLHPAPRTRVMVAVPSTPEEAFAIASAVVRAAVEPAALEWSAGTLHVLLEGTPEGAEDAAGQVLELAGGGEVMTASAEHGAREAGAAVSTGETGDTVLRVGTGPGDSAWLPARAPELAELYGLDLALTSSIGAGMHTLRLRAGDPRAHTGFMTELQEELAVRKGTGVVCRPDGLGPAAPTRGRPPAGVEVMRAIKDRFDPRGRLGAGRFAPWF